MLNNIVSLYGVQFATLLLPLVTLPYLARVLQPTVWGQVAAVQSLALTLALLVEYGFVYSAVRTIAATPGQQDVHSRIAANVLSAKLVLSGVAVLLGLLVFLALPAFREQPELFAFGMLYAVVQGFTPLWYFQGTENLRAAAMTDVAMKALATGLIFLFVRAPDDAWLVLALQGMAIGVAQIINHVRLYRQMAFRWPSMIAAREGLRDGWSMFLFRGAVGMYTTANAAMLRAFVPSPVVANYVNADRFASAAKSFTQPITQVLFPRISHLVRHDAPSAYRMVRRSLTVMVALSTALGAAAYLIAPVFIPWFFGALYADSIPIFQLLCLTLPMVAASNVLGVQWMLPHGLDRAFNTIIMSTGVLNVLLVLALVPQYQATGMAYAVVLSETFVTITMVTYLSIRGLSPLRKVNPTA